MRENEFREGEGCAEYEKRTVSGETVIGNGVITTSGIGAHTEGFADITYLLVVLAAA